MIPTFDKAKQVWVYEVTQGTHHLLAQYMTQTGQGLEQALRTLLSKTVKKQKT